MGFILAGFSVLVTDALVFFWGIPFSSLKSWFLAAG
jgi:hypothetical protein